jgi:hypothetical protein
MVPSFSVKRGFDGRRTHWNIAPKFDWILRWVVCSYLAAATLLRIECKILAPSTRASRMLHSACSRITNPVCPGKTLVGVSRARSPLIFCRLADDERPCDRWSCGVLRAAGDGDMNRIQRHVLNDFLKQHGLSTEGKDVQAAVSHADLTSCSLFSCL